MMTLSLRRLMMILMLAFAAAAFTTACGDLDGEEGQCDPELDGDDCVCDDDEDLSTCFFIEEDTFDVGIEGSGFSPQTLEINAGDTVVWTNNDANDHTVTCENCPNGVTFPDDDLLAPGASFQFTFDDPGTYNIVDRLNAGDAFSSTITVQ